jgi:hypothetical protein
MFADAAWEFTTATEVGGHLDFGMEAFQKIFRAAKLCPANQHGAEMADITTSKAPLETPLPAFSTPRPH